VRIEEIDMKAKTEMISCMNNTKWHEFFEAVNAEPILRDIPFFIKCLDCTNAFEETLSFAEITDIGLFAYWSSLIDRNDRKTEKGNCWLSYVDIEWLFLPNIYDKDIYCKLRKNNPLFKIENYTVEAHIITLKSLIDELGKLTYDFDDAGLKLYGYKLGWSVK